PGATKSASYFGSSSVINFCAYCKRPRYSSAVMGCTREPSGWSAEKASGRTSASLAGLVVALGRVARPAREKAAPLCKNSRREDCFGTFEVCFSMAEESFLCAGAACQDSSSRTKKREALDERLPERPAGKQRVAPDRQS